MLKARLITAALLIPMAMLCIFKLPNVTFQLVTAVVVLLASMEWATIAGIKSTLPKLLFMTCLTGSLYFVRMIPFGYIFIAACAWWAIAFALLGFSKRGWATTWVLVIQAFFVLVPFWVGLNILRDIPPRGMMLVYVLFLVWITDSGAYFAGKHMGKHKLAPTISPKKTWEGLVGGVVLAMIFAYYIGVMFGSKSAPLSVQISHYALALLTCLVSVGGDLYESLIKRIRGVKDSGNLLPGHGGILDRIDSLTAAIPVFTMGWILLQLH